VKFFFDNNLPLTLAHAVRELCRHEVHVVEVVHLRDKFAADEQDHVWISAIGQEKGWIIISQDGFSKNDLERQALRQSGLIVFVLSKQWSSHQFWQKSHTLVRWWPAIIEQSQKIKGGAAFRVPWKFSGPGRFEVIRL